MLARDFRYLEFMDKALVTPAVLHQIVGDDDCIMDRFQWIGRMLLKLVTIHRCLKLAISSNIRASREAKDLVESLRLLKVENVTFEKFHYP